MGPYGEWCRVIASNIFVYFRKNFTTANDIWIWDGRDSFCLAFQKEMFMNNNTSFFIQI